MTLLRLGVIASTFSLMLLFCYVALRDSFASFRPVSCTVVDQHMEHHNFRRRQAFKAEAGQQVEQRDEQFQNITALKEQYHAQGNPVMSMDVKKKK